MQVYLFAVIAIPYLGVLSPFIFYVHFKTVYFRLTHLYLQPEGSVNEDVRSILL